MFMLLSLPLCVSPIGPVIRAVLAYPYLCISIANALQCGETVCAGSRMAAIQSSNFDFLFSLEYRLESY
jgi:hypothetical protein